MPVSLSRDNDGQSMRLKAIVALALAVEFDRLGSKADMALLN